MPIYDFECKNCGNTKEYIVNSDSNDVKCEKCGSAMVRLFPNKIDFRLLYDPKKDRVSWSFDGYATTQRYREYDKQAKHNIFVQPGEKDTVK